MERMIADYVRDGILTGIISDASWKVDVDTDEIDEEGEEGYEILAQSIESGCTSGIIGWSSIAWDLTFNKDGKQCSQYDIDYIEDEE